MLQRSFYFPTELYKELQKEAKTQGVATAVLIRRFLEEGLKSQKRKKISGTEFLLKLTDYHLSKGPSDLAKNHDKYTWE